MSENKKLELIQYMCKLYCLDINTVDKELGQEMFRVIEEAKSLNGETIEDIIYEYSLIFEDHGAKRTTNINRRHYKQEEHSAEWLNESWD
jgi:hypothetical protein